MYLIFIKYYDWALFYLFHFQNQHERTIRKESNSQTTFMQNQRTWKSSSTKLILRVEFHIEFYFRPLITEFKRKLKKKRRREKNEGRKTKGKRKSSAISSFHHQTANTHIHTYTHRIFSFSFLISLFLSLSSFFPPPLKFATANPCLISVSGAAYFAILMMASLFDWSAATLIK